MSDLILYCRWHQKSTPQTNAKDLLWRQKIPARLPSSTQCSGLRASFGRTPAWVLTYQDKERHPYLDIKIRGTVSMVTQRAPPPLDPYLDIKIRNGALILISR